MLLNADTLTLTVPLDSVLAVSCAVGAQCNPARTHTPFAPKLAAKVIGSVSFGAKDRTPPKSLLLSELKTEKPLRF